MTASHLVYEVATGLIVKQVVGPRVRLSPGQAMIEGDGPGPDHYVHAGLVLALPPRPGPWAVFDPVGGAWTDPRDAATRAADVALALANARTAATARINAQSGAIRARFVTALPGQEMIYLRKEAEARAWIALPAPPADMAGFPFMAAETGITAPDADQLAQVYLNLAALWTGVGAALERLRLGAIAQVATAPDIEAAAGRLQDALAGIGAFAAATGVPATGAKQEQTHG